MILNLREKYGPEILEDLNNLNHDLFNDLTQIAKKYKVTRERARQWYKMIFGHGYRKILKEKTKKRNQDIACVHDPRRKVADYKKDSVMYRAAKVEKMFLKKCQKIKLGFNVPCTGEVDIKVNGYMVDVKSCSNPKRYSPGAKIKYFRYIAKGTQIETADFFACYHPVEKVFFIIPRAATNEIGKADLISIYINECQSNYHTARNRYWEFRDAWYLLKNKKNLTAINQ